MDMDRRNNYDMGMPPGFNWKTHSRMPDTVPMAIPHRYGTKSVPQMVDKPPSIAASAPEVATSCLNFLMNSSTERRSLSPHKKMGYPQINHFDKTKVLSCSDLESALTGRFHEASRLYHEYRPPFPRPSVPTFDQLPPIQACAPRPPLPIQIPRMIRGHNLQPLLLGHQIPGQNMVPVMRAPVRPPPGFEASLPTTPPSPLPPPSQFSSPHPWSPARLAPMFQRNEGISEGMSGIEVKAAPSVIFPSFLTSVGEVSNGQLVSKEKDQNDARPLNYTEPPTSTRSSLNFDRNIGPTNRGPDPNGLIVEKETNDTSSSVKKKKKKKEKKKVKTIEEKQIESTLEVLAKSSPPKNNKNSGSENGVDETDNSISEIKDMELFESQDTNGTNSIDLDKEKERLNNLKKMLKNKKKNEKFDPYLSSEEVESGLAEKKLIEAEIRINQRNYKEAFISDPEDEQDIIIMGLKDRNRALDGDIVVVRLKDEADWPKTKKGNTQRSGKVVFIKEKVHHRCTVGTLHVVDKGMVLLIPRDQRFPLLKVRPHSIPINLLENLSSANIDSVLFKASITSWIITKYANGMIKKKIGKKGDMEGETTAIFEELGLDRKPIPDSPTYLPPLPYYITEDEISSRVDLRSELIFTIDPPTARDLDDAVSIKKLSDDTFEVGVHISDVSYYVPEGKKLDELISKRATTVYMVEEACHMLPIALCGICSLNPGEDKLTVSVLMTVNKEGCVLNKEFKRSIINSCAQLSYDEVQDVIEGKDIEFQEIYNNVQICDIKNAILHLHELSTKFRKKRFDGGALKIDQPKIWFSLDEDSMPRSLAVYDIKDSHRLIEEFMLLANESVARYIHEKAPDIALLRRHDPPKNEMMKRLLKSLNDIGIDLDASSAGNLHLSLSSYCDSDEMKSHVLYHLCARPMKRAVYFCSCEDTHHYALNKEKYTHFTSPIRRYADIIVHRILLACLDLTPMPSWDVQKIKRLASVCNTKKYSAKRASEMSCDLFRMLYIKRVGSVTADALVVSVCSQSLNVIVPSLAYNTKISLEKMDDIKFDFIDDDMNSSMKIKWPAVEKEQELKIFSLIKVLIICVNNKHQVPQLQTVLLPPQSCPS